jgi:hypothetical protein
MRLDATFSAYKVMSRVNSRKAFRDLVARVKFLTGNSRLLNSKSGAAIGIYYNNSLIDDLSSLDNLDKILKTKIKPLKSGRLKKRLKPFGFCKGFQERCFHHFSPQELRKIVRVWKHA